MTHHDSISNRLFQIAREYSQALQVHLGDRLITVGLYGSVARNEASPFSDIDLLLVIKGLPRGRFARMDLLEPVNARIDPSPGTSEGGGYFFGYLSGYKDPGRGPKADPLVPRLGGRLADTP